MAGIRYDGNKSRLFKKIEPYIPKNFNMHIEPFLGGGGFFYSMLENGYLDNCNNIFLNDLSPYSYWLFKYLLDEKTNKKLVKMAQNCFSNTTDLSVYIEKHKENIRANKKELSLRDVFEFLYIRFFSVNGFLCLKKGNYKLNLLKAIEKALINKEVKLCGHDSVKFLNSISLRAMKEPTKSDECPFFYLDPPYQNTKTDLYNCSNGDNILINCIEKIKKKTGLAYERTSVLVSYSENEIIEEYMINEGFKKIALEQSRNKKKSSSEILYVKYAKQNNLTLF